MRSLLPALLSSLALPAWAEVPKVMTDIVPVHSLVAQVMEGVGSPELLLDAGADAHSFQLRPSQAAGLAEADLVVWIGPEMTPWLDRALDSLTGNARHLDLIHAKGTTLRSFEGEEGEHKDEHGHEGEHDHEEEHAAEEEHGHDHDHTGTDPHAWLNPENATLWLGLIAEELATIDPANAEKYRTNAAGAQSNLTALDNEISAQLAPARDKAFVVFHDAYGYFTDHYGMTKALAVAEGDAAAPGAAHLAELQATVSASGSICLFPEAQHDPSLITQLADGTGARIGGVLDPEGSQVPSGPEAYEAVMRGLAGTITACLLP